jgi:hypothetical protein
MERVRLWWWCSYNGSHHDWRLDACPAGLERGDQYEGGGEQYESGGNSMRRRWGEQYEEEVGGAV